MWGRKKAQIDNKKITGVGELQKINFLVFFNFLVNNNAYWSWLLPFWIKKRENRLLLKNANYNTNIVKMLLKKYLNRSNLLNLLNLQFNFVSKFTNLLKKNLNLLNDRSKINKSSLEIWIFCNGIVFVKIYKLFFFSRWHFVSVISIANYFNSIERQVESKFPHNELCKFSLGSNLAKRQGALTLKVSDCLYPLMSDRTGIIRWKEEKAVEVWINQRNRLAWRRGRD